jgi:hypothetical protein
LKRRGGQRLMNIGLCPMFLSGDVNFKQKRATNPMSTWRPPYLRGRDAYHPPATETLVDRKVGG